jgi:hypothetical protein
MSAWAMEHPYLTFFIIVALIEAISGVMVRALK